jgi:hypothetical protein
VRRFIFLLVALSLASCRAVESSPYQPQHGDLVFQSLAHNPVIDAIEGCTHSPYSHCGIVVHRAGSWFVLEAIGPVQEKPLNRWILQGRSRQFAVYRLKPEQQKHIPAMIAAARRFIGRPYDIQYELDDEKIYCSELIYKSWLAATRQQLGKLVKLSDLNWKPHELVIRQIARGLPLDRVMITPRDLAAAQQLDRILPLASHSLSR